MPGPEVIAFDFDDTLLDWPATLQATLAAMAITPELAERYLALAPTTWRSEEGVVIHRNTWRLGEYPEEHWDQLGHPHLAASFREALALQPMPGALDALRRARARATVAICTNNAYVHRELTALGWADEFDHVEIALDPPKPERAAFAKLCALVGAPPERIWFVGDSVHSDVRGAHGAGLRAIWLDRYDDAWSPPPGVHRIRELHELFHLEGWAP